MKPAAAAKAIGDQDSQGLRDVIGGRKRLSAELLAALSTTGVDVQYVLTGQRVDVSLSSDERQLLALYRSAPLAVKMAAVGALQGAQGATQHVGVVVGQNTNTGKIINHPPKPKKT
ncbi:MAG: hypothetical protein C4516_04290 [Oxalobacter sp.]|nr:MAG: hypothetical protein C4516_04290 [Oxalobacter sp.]